MGNNNIPQRIVLYWLVESSRTKSTVIVSSCTCGSDYVLWETEVFKLKEVWGGNKKNKQKNKLL